MGEFGKVTNYYYHMSEWRSKSNRPIPHYGIFQYTRPCLIFISCTERFSDIIASINDSSHLVHLSARPKNGGNVN
ncbi:MAG: hypothetical protein ABSH41_28340, partial [Syntrophobacteraceae bacterium]